MSVRRKGSVFGKRYPKVPVCDLRAHSHGYEFGGPIGVLVQMIAMPCFVIAIVSSYEATGCEFKKVSTDICVLYEYA